MWFELTLGKRLPDQLASDSVPNPCFFLLQEEGKKSKLIC